MLRIEVLFVVDMDTIDNDEGDELLQNIKLKNDGETKYKKGIAYCDLTIDPIRQLHEGYLMAKDGCRYAYTTITFQSGASMTALGKPDKVLDKILDYYLSLKK